MVPPPERSTLAGGVVVGWRLKQRAGTAVRQSHSPPRGRQIVCLKDAAEYIQKLPKAEQHLEEWQAAVEALLLVVEFNGPTMMAHIGMLRALNRHVERVFNPSRKDTQWGKRKLRRDQ